jgi:hypothetical protein
LLLLRYFVFAFVIAFRLSFFPYFQFLFLYHLRPLLCCSGLFLGCWFLFLFDWFHSISSTCARCYVSEHVLWVWCLR